MSTSLPATQRLAVDGGPSIVPRGAMMLSRWPRIDEDDVDRVLRQLRAGLLTEMTGQQFVHAFESEIAMFTGTRYVLTTNSGTAALHCALAGLGVQAGDEVVLPALGFIACPAAVIHQQAIPIFADVDPLTYNLTPESVEAAITPRTTAIMVVHLHGLPTDMDAMRAIAVRHGVPVLEDFSQAFGARFRGRPVGGLSEVGAASVVAGKNLPAAGEGGVVVTHDREIRNRAASLKCFGEVVHADGTHELTHETMGWNYRSSPLALALASQQLFRLDDYTRARRDSAALLDATLAEIPGLAPPVVPDGCEPAFHMYRFRVDPDAAGLDVTTDQFRVALREIFWAEGLPLVEFQNAPLPQHPLLQRKVGYGRGCPWTCHGRDDIVYDRDAFPGALDALRSSLVVGIPAQAVLCNAEVVDAYLRCFEKLAMNLPAFERYAAGLRSTAPWDDAPRLFG